MSRHTVDHRAHAELAHTEEDVASLGSTWKLGESLKMVLVEAVRSAAPPKSSGTHTGDGVHHHLSGVTGCNRLVGREGGNLLLPAFGQLGLDGAVELSGRLRIRLRVLIETLLPFFVSLLALGLGLAPVLRGLFRYVEGLVLGPAQILLGSLHRLCAQRLAVNLAGASLGTCRSR